jgi:hypothetical protein
VRDLQSPMKGHFGQIPSAYTPSTSKNAPSGCSSFATGPSWQSY